MFRKTMDRIACYVNGKCIGQGYRFGMSDISTQCDDFETPSDMFQTCINMYVPEQRFQLEMLRYMMVYWTPQEVAVQCRMPQCYGTSLQKENRPLQDAPLIAALKSTASALQCMN